MIEVLRVIAEAPPPGGGSGLGYLVTVMVALVSGTGGWSLLQFIFNRRGRKAEAARLTAQTEQARSDAQEAEAKRLSILSDLQNRAQQIAIESAANAYERVAKECDNCRNELRACQLELKSLRRATETLIRLAEDAFPYVIAAAAQLPPDYENRLRLSIQMARDNL